MSVLDKDNGFFTDMSTGLEQMLKNMSGPTFSCSKSSKEAAL